MRKVCVECGKSVGKTDKFCRHCRAELPDGREKPAPEDGAVLDETAIDAFDGLDQLPVGETEETPSPETPVPAADEPEEETAPVAEEKPAKDFYAPVPKHTLTVVEGDQRGMKFECFEGRPLVIGGSARADIRLPGDEYVSGIHAKVTAETNGLVVEDQSSTNGSFLKLDGPHRLVPGELVLFGRTLLRVGKD